MTAEANSIRILVAEDNDSNFLLINAILKRRGTLTRVINGKEAVNAVKNGEYDIVLMDIRMPEMDGLEATRLIREFNNTIPIVAVTANAFNSDKIKALEAGCSNFITKPVNKEELFTILDNL